MHDIGATRLEMGGQSETQFYQAGSPFGEMQELQLASELLEISSEAELEQFLGNILSAVGGAARQFARSDTGQALGGILKDAARQALPVVGQAVGKWVSPNYGGPIGQTVATQAGKWMGLELEGLSNEDREFEVARLVVELNGFGEDTAPHLIASMYRHLAYWPAYLALVRTMLAPLQADGRLDALTHATRALGHAHGQMLAPQLKPAPSPDTLAAVLKSCRLFVEHPIARMTGLCALIRRATPA